MADIAQCPTCGFQFDPWGDEQPDLQVFASDSDSQVTLELRDSQETLQLGADKIELGQIVCPKCGETKNLVFLDQEDDQCQDPPTQ